MRSRRRPARALLVAALLFQPTMSRAQEEPERAALLTAADSLYAERDYSAAAAAYERALARVPAGRPELRHRALVGLATAWRLTGRVRESITLLERALDLARGRADRARELEALRGIGISRHDLAHHGLALQAYDAALAIARELGDGRAEGTLWNNIASVRYRQGDYVGAIEALERALSLMDPNTPDYVRALTNLGRARMFLGEYSAALELYEQARERAARFDDPHLEGLIWNRFAVLYDRTGQNELAWEANTRSLEITRATGLRQGTSATLENLGILREKAGDLEGALDYLQQAHAIQREDGDDTGAGTTLKLIADVHRLRGDLARARDTYREALAIDVRAGQIGQAGLPRLGLVDVLVDLGEFEAALAHSDTALASAREIGHADLEAQAGHRRAVALRAMGRPAEALATLADATRGIETLRAGLASDPAKIGFLEERQRPFHEMVDLLIEMGRPLDALVVAERGRARAFVDLLAGRVSLPDAAGGDRLARVREAHVELREAIATPDSSGVAGPGTLLALRAARALETELAELAEEDEELASLVSAQSASAAEIEGLARSREVTLLEYLIADERLTIWVVAPDGTVRARVLPVGRDSIRAAVSRVRTTWEAGLSTGLGPETMALDDLAALDHLLVEPVEPWLPADPDAVVYVFPHDALHLLSFAALRDAAGRWLVERHTLGHAPSISVLKWLLENEAGPPAVVTAATDARGGRPRATLDWLGIGDPAAPAGTGLEPLPWAEREVRGVADRFAAERRLVLTGAAATEASLRAHAPGRRILHFAGHGIISDEEPLASALVLAAGDGEDGYLRTPEIFALDLDAELVVLSGCSTGLGKLTGDGVLGLSRAFLYAGAAAVIVSQWDVSDRATAELMDRFYEFYLAGARGEPSLEAARALREAQRGLLARYPHPYLWAAFHLTGRAR